MAPSIYDSVKEVPEDPILSLASIFKNDPRSNKIDLTIGVYRDDQGYSLPMKVVRRAEKVLVEEPHSKVYLPIDGDQDYLNEMGKLVFGLKLYEKIHSSLVKAQTVGGTSALYLLSRFFRETISKAVWISDPTWVNHIGIFESSKYEINKYPYYDFSSHSLLFEQILSSIDKAKENDIILLHGCCHNPTGHDLDKNQLQQILEIVKRKKLIPLFDFAYQGFGVSLDQDAEAIRHFAAEGIPMAVAVSNSKNFGLYADRIGSLFILTENPKLAKKVLGKIKSLIRVDFSNPPKHGSMIISKILNDPILKQDWIDELKSYQKRISNIRSSFFEKLAAAGLSESFKHLKLTQGMFCFTGLSPSDVKKIQDERAIFMTGQGRINITGLNKVNLDIVVDAIASVKKHHA